MIPFVNLTCCEKGKTKNPADLQGGQDSQNCGDLNHFIVNFLHAAILGLSESLSCPTRFMPRWEENIPEQRNPEGAFASFGMVQYAFMTFECALMLPDEVKSVNTIFSFTLIDVTSVNELKVKFKGAFITSAWKNKRPPFELLQFVGLLKSDHEIGRSVHGIPDSSRLHGSQRRGKRLDSTDVEIEVVGSDMISPVTGTPP